MNDLPSRTAWCVPQGSFGSISWSTTADGGRKYSLRGVSLPGFGYVGRLEPGPPSNSTNGAPQRAQPTRGEPQEAHSSPCSGRWRQESLWHSWRLPHMRRRRALTTGGESHEQTDDLAEHGRPLRPERDEPDLRRGRRRATPPPRRHAQAKARALQRCKAPAQPRREAVCGRSKARTSRARSATRARRPARKPARRGRGTR